MAGSVNRVILVGNVGKDVEIVAFEKSGDKIAKFSIATSETWRDKKTGDRMETTEWHRVVVFDPQLVEVAERRIKKGVKVYLCGRQKTRKWQDRQGNDRWTTETVVPRFDGELQVLASDGGGQAPDEHGYGQTRPAGQPVKKFSSDPDDDIPF